MKADATPWSAMLKIAASLGLTPAEFWRTSLKDWRALVSPATNEALTRSAFDAMSARFPDQT